MCSHSKSFSQTRCSSTLICSFLLVVCPNTRTAGITVTCQILDVPPNLVLWCKTWFVCSSERGKFVETWLPPMSRQWGWLQRRAIGTHICCQLLTQLGPSFNEPGLWSILSGRLTVWVWCRCRQPTASTGIRYILWCLQFWPDACINWDQWSCIG